MNNHILFGYQLDGKGGGKSLLNNRGYEETKSNSGIVWTHLDANHNGTRPWLDKEISSIDPYIVDALLANETRPRFIQIQDGVLIILRGMNLNKNDTPEDMISIRLWVEKNRIISVRLRSLQVMDDIVANIESKIGPKNAGDFVTNLIAKLSNRMESVLLDLDDKLVDIEEQIIDKADIALREAIIDTRKQAIIFRRYIVPQRDVVEQLRLSSLSWIDVKHKRYLVEVYNHIVRYIEDLEEARDRSQVVKDELSNALSDKLNKNMYFLAVIAAIFLPLSFLTGLLGINVAGIPGSNNANAFWIFSIGLALIVAIQIFLFKKLKWI
ncbi:MAG: zinc transporter [Francisella sp.]|jgi:zinc transporter